MDMAWVSCAAHSVQGKMVKLAIDGAEKIVSPFLFAAST